MKWISGLLSKKLNSNWSRTYFNNFSASWLEVTSVLY